MLSPLYRELLEEEEGLLDSVALLLNSPDFWAPLTSSVVPTRGYGAASYTRATTRTLADQDGRINTLLAGEPGFQGARRVRNLVSVASEDNTLGTPISANAVVATKTVTFTLADGSFFYKRAFFTGISNQIYRFRATVSCTVNRTVMFRAGNSTTPANDVRANVQVGPVAQEFSVLLLLTGAATGVDFGIDNRSAFGATDTTVNGVFTFTNVQIEEVTGQTNTNPGEYVPVGLPKVNELIFTEALDNAVWTKNAVTVAADATTNNAGVPSADKIQEDNTNASHFVLQAVAKSAAATIYTVTWKLKQAERSWAWVFLEDGTAANGVVGYFNLATGATGAFGAIGAGWVASAIVTVPDGNGFFQCVMTVVTNATASIRAWAGPATGNNVNTYVGVTGSGIYSGGVQLNQGVYNGVTAVGNVYPFNGSCVDGVKCFETVNGNTVAANVITAGVGAPIASTVLLGYLSELAGTNLCLQSEDFATTWVASNATITANSSFTPSGPQTADTLVATAASGNVNQSFAKAASSLAYTLSAYFKPGTVNIVRLQIGETNAFAIGAAVEFNVATGAISTAAAAIGAGFTAISASITPAFNGYYRLVLNATSTAVATLAVSVGHNAAAVNTNTIIGWGAQLEQSLFATSYIPTTTTAVTRNGDQLTYPSAGNALAAAGVLYVETALTPGDTGTLVAAAISDGTVNNRVTIFNSAPGGNAGYRVTSGGVAQLANTGVNAYPAAGTVAKQAIRWSAADAAAYLNGVLDRATGAGIAPPAALTQINAGVSETGTGSQPGGTNRNIKVWTASNSDQFMQRATN